MVHYFRNVKGIPFDGVVLRKLLSMGCVSAAEEGASPEAVTIPIDDCLKDPSNPREIDRFIHPDRVDGLITQYIGKVLDTFAPGNHKQELKLRNPQQKVIRDILAGYQRNNRQMGVLAPRSGKSLIGLYVATKLLKQGKIKHVTLPAYWLSVLPSYLSEVLKYREFQDWTYITLENISQFDPAKPSIIEISLRESNQWRSKYKAISKLNPDECLYILDEADFGTHTTRQQEALDYLGAYHTDAKMLAMSGTNAFRVARAANQVHNVHYLSYTTLEREPEYIKRQFYSLAWDGLQESLVKHDVKFNEWPSWRKLWNVPEEPEAIQTLFKALTGQT
ncbi:MAG: hypothetical protein ACREQ5_37365, partial [Candidatus Dormibacteria bacterium]